MKGRKRVGGGGNVGWGECGGKRGNQDADGNREANSV